MDTLADGDDPSDKIPFKHLLKAAESIFKNKGYKPGMLAEPEGRRLINDIYDTFRQAVDEGIADNDIPESMARKLDRDTFMFSGFKAHHELSEVGLALRDRDGKVKGYDAFEHDVLKIHNTYNQNYLKSEYGFAVASSQMAAKWQDVEAGRGRYDLQYRTAGDDRVREEHAAMHGITLPSDDPFWDKYYPPNGWRCRCTAVEVNKGKFPVSDSKEAERIGDKATTHLDRFGNNKDKIFRFNPGKEGKVFPPKHPYGKVDKEVKETVERLSREIHTPEDIVDFINADETRKQWFERGFSKLITTNKRGVNGYTDMNGLIALIPERMNNAIQGLDKMKSGKHISFAEADALATLWHEVTHNRNRPGNMRITGKQRDFMELANEFVARKTLPEFYKACGGELQHPEFMENRDSTGYNPWVKRYDRIISETKADRIGVLESVRKYLFNEPYTNQKEGLVSALEKNGARIAGRTLQKSEINRLVSACLTGDATLNNMIQSLVVKGK